MYQDFKDTCLILVMPFLRLKGQLVKCVIAEYRIRKRRANCQGQGATSSAGDLEIGAPTQSPNNLAFPL